MQNVIGKTSNGGKPISGALLILQGLADANADAGMTTQAVEATQATNPESQVEYQTWEAVVHDPVMVTSQQVWLQWIADRFAGKPVPQELSRTNHTLLLPPQRYQSDTNWIVKSATDMYKLAMP